MEEISRLSRGKRCMGEAGLWEDDSGSFPLIPNKISRRETDWSKCVKCQKTSRYEKVVLAKQESLERFQSASLKRQDSVYYRLLPDFDSLTGKNVKWHPNCYKSYTSKRNLAFCQPASSTVNKVGSTSKVSVNADNTQTGGKENVCPIKRFQTASMKFDLCLFCQKVSYKNDRSLSTVLTKGTEEKF